LKKTEHLVKGLGEVEPPPFFEQRIMTRVREEAEKEKGLFRRFFYPLRIKIPIQVMATVLVAVLAFYIYQKNEPEMKHMTPFPIPLNETEQGQIAAKTPKVLPAPSAVQPAKRAPAADLTEKDHQQFAAPPFEKKGKADRAADLPVPILEERPSAMKPGALVMAAREKEVPSGRAEILDKAQDRAGKQEVGKTLDTLLPEQKRNEKKADTIATAEESRTTKFAPALSRLKAATAKNRSAVDLTIQVRDMTIAVREIEERLGQVNAQVVERTHHQGSQILKVEMAAQKVAAFLDRLETVGKINLDQNTLDLPDGKVTLSIRIVTVP
jgi:hypothetical protein